MVGAPHRQPTSASAPMKSRVSPTGSYLFRVQKKRDLIRLPRPPPPRTISDFLRRPSHIDRGPQSRSTPRFVARPLHPPPPPSADSSRCRSRRRCPRARPACPSFVRPPPPSAPTSRTKCMQTVCADAIDLQQTQRLVHIELIEWRGGSTQRGTESRMRGRGLPGVPMRLSTRWVNVAGWCSGRGIELTVEGWACRQHRATRYASIATLLPRAPRVFAAGRPRQRASANPD